MIGLKSLLCSFLLLSLSIVEAGTQSFSVSSTQAYAPATITFDASGINQAKKYLWTFGDGGTLTTTNPITSYQYKSAGNFTAKLSFQVNASDKNPNYKDAGSVAITILARQQQNLPPTASLSCSVNNLLLNCNGFGSVDPQGKPLSFLFSYGDNFSESNTTGLSSHAVSAAGLYAVTLTVTNSAGLSSTATTQVQAVLPPNVLPSLVLNCSSDVINTLSCNANGSTDSDGSIVSYKYAWDDNTSDSKADSSAITHLFSTSGNHTVTLTAVDNDGGVSTLSKSFSVKANTLPVANFSCDTSKPQRVTCSSNSTDADSGDSIQSYSWKFGNASAFSTTTPNTDYDFKTGGSFDITLSVTDTYGGVGSITKTIVVKNNIPPVASFSCSNTGVRTIHCDSTSTDSDGTIASTAWSLDDGTNLSGASYDHTFSDDKAHVVNLIVTDDLGASTSANQTVQPNQNQAPQLDISASTTSGVAPLAINFTANALDSDGVVSGVNWSYSDGGSDVGANASHTFSTPGTYAVTATATDNLGATITKSLSVTVTAPIVKIPPTAFFKVYEFDTWVELHSTLTKAQYDIKRAYYTIDGASTVEVTEFYPNTINWIDLKTFGWHEIKLTVVDIYGQQSTFTQEVNQVEDLDTLAPFVDFKIQQSAARTVFLNFNRSFDYDIDQGIQSFHVDYGNGESEDTTNLYLNHTYSTAGTYAITVTAYTIHGTQDTASKQFTVSDSAPATILPPVVNFGYRIYDFAQNVSFYNDKSGTPNGTILSYVWDFGDGQTGAGQKVAHFYDPGSYFVTLTIVDSSGQSSSQTQHITIFGTGSNLVAQLGCDIAKPYFDFTQTCQVFALDKQNQITRVRVNWGDGTANNLTLPSVNGIFRPTHKYASAGTYTVTETVTTSRGELATATTTLTLTKYNPVVASIQCTTNNLLVNCNALGSYDVTGLPLTYTFDYGDSYTETNTTGISSHSYTDAGTYNVKVEVTNGVGSSSEAIAVVMPIMPINPPPVAKINCITQANRILCDALSSYDVNGGIAFALWDFGDGTTSSGMVVDHQYNSFGQYTVKLTVTNIAFSSSVVTQVIPVNSFAPTALGKCSVTSQVLACDGTDSYDTDGTIADYKWIIDGEAEISGDKINYEFTSSGVKNVSLKITDNDGNITNKLIDSFNITNSPPVALFSCANIDDAHLKCSANSSSDDGRITSYTWQVNEDIYNGSLQNFSFSSDGDYVISLRVVDNMGLEGNTSQTYSLTPSSFFNKSLAMISSVPLSEGSLFYPLTGKIVFQISNANLSSVVTSNQVSLNGNILDSSKIEYLFSDNKIILDLELINGKNTISFALQDDQGKAINNEATIYAGTREVDLNLADDSGSLLQNSLLELAPTADKKTSFKINVATGRIHLSNVPSEDFLIKGTIGEQRGDNVLFKNDSSLQISLHGYSSVTDNQNNHFANGITGWDAKDSGYLIGDSSLKITPNSNGVGTLRKTLNATAESPVVTFGYTIHSSYKDEYFSLTMRNRATGEVRYDFFSTESVLIETGTGDLSSNDFKIERSISTKSANDVVEIELKLFTRHGIENATIVSNLLDFFLPKANAYVISGIEGVVFGYDLGLFKISGVELYDNMSDLSGESLTHISVGKLPTYTEYDPTVDIFVTETTFPLANNQGVYESTNKIYVDFNAENLNNEKIISAKIELLNPDNKYVLMEDASTSIIQDNGSSKRAVFNIKSFPIDYTDIPKKVVLRLTIVTSSGRQDSVIINNDDSPSYFTSLVSLTSYISSFDKYRFGGRDVEDAGGDDWIRPEFVNFINNLVDPIGLPRQLNVTFNDFSKMNGGYFPPHFEHGNGNVFDGFMDDFNDNTSNLVSTRLSALSLLAFLNDGSVSPMATKVFVSYGDGSPFGIEIQSSCLANGYLARKFIKNDKSDPERNHKAGHKNHFHLEFSNGNAFPGRSTSFEICHKLDTDLKTIQIQKCATGESLDPNQYEVWAKKVNSQDQYQELSNDRFGYDYSPLDGNLLELKILFIGNGRNIGCFEKIAYTDARSKANNCSDESEYGITYIGTSTECLSNITGECSSLTVGKSSVFQIYPDPQQWQKDQNNGTKYRVPLSYATSLNSYSSSSVCNNSKILDNSDGVSNIPQMLLNNTKITNGSTVREQTHLYDAIIDNSEIGAGEIWANFESVVIKDSSVVGQVMISNAKVTDSDLTYPTLPENAAWAIIDSINIDNTTINNGGFNQQSMFGNYLGVGNSSMRDSYIENSALHGENIISSNIYNSLVEVNVANAEIVNSLLYATINPDFTFSGTVINSYCDAYNNTNTYTCRAR